MSTSNDQRIRKPESSVSDHGERIRMLESTVSKRDRRIGELENTVDRRDERIGELESAVGRRDGRIRELERAVDLDDDKLRELQIVQIVMSDVYESRADTPGLDQYAAASTDIESTDISTRLIAFYLPQFYPIPENDEWWGKGFTEWTNVAKAKPNYMEHYQPRLPNDLGFYDLRVEDIMEQQADLARRYGIYGFCYHYYWFGGRRLLEMPIERMLETGKPDIPFCLLWDNESWTRTWNGEDGHVLVPQQHGDEDDFTVIRDISRYMRHPNYITVDGKPLLLVYRIGLLPDINATVARWREFCLNEGVGEIYLALCCTDEHSTYDPDPALYGMDALVEYPPHNAGICTDSPGMMINSEFEGKIFSYPEIVDMYTKKEVPKNIVKFRGVMPDWDNTARQQDRGRIYHGSTPKLYKKWLKEMISQTRKRHRGGKRLIFVNAWNKWTEGAYLEPDLKYGHAYLNATRSAIEEAASEAETSRGILIVAHNMYHGGAEILALAIARGFVKQLGLDVYVASLGEDINLLSQFEEFGIVSRLEEGGDIVEALRKFARQVYNKGVRCVLLNTVVTGSLVEVMKSEGFRVINLIHELPFRIAQANLEQAAITAASHSDLLVFATPVAMQGIESIIPIVSDVEICPQGIYNPMRNKIGINKALMRRALCASIGIDESAKIVIGVGNADYHKGVDLFVDVALQVKNKLPNVHFIWAGAINYDFISPSDHDAIGTNIHLVGHQENIVPFFASADIFAMTSRADTFPSVVLEAMDAGIPIIGFEDAGGFCELLREGAGVLVPYEDAKMFAYEVLRLCSNPDHASAIGNVGRQIIASRFGWTQYLFDLARMMEIPFYRVSVVVPNYNYLRYMDERLSSIVNQSYPIYELIILDDASSDGSQDWLRKEAHKLFPDVRLVFNESNSGSVFAQWLKGSELATGDILWIAEADDSCEPNLLETMLKSFSNPEVVLSYCQPKQIDAEGGIITDNCLDYTQDISADKWCFDHVADARQELPLYFPVKNPILNVSGVLTRREPFVEVLGTYIEQICRFKCAGDWLTYVLLLERGGLVAYHAETLNKLRTHDDSVIALNRGEKEMPEIMAVQCIVRERHPVHKESVEQAYEYCEHLYNLYCDTENVTLERLYEISDQLTSGLI